MNRAPGELRGFLLERQKYCRAFLWKWSNRGAPTGSATVVRLTERPEMLLAAKRIARRLGLSGFFGLDFMLRPARRFLSK